MKWDARTELLSAKESRAQMRAYAISARLIIHPSERNPAESFSEMCNRAVCFIRYALGHRHYTVVHLKRAAELAGQAPRNGALKGGAS